VTVQQQILDHLDTLTAKLGVAVLLITHDLGLAAERAQHLVVMYKGRIVESGPAIELLQNPQHPYTKRLIAAAPSLASRRLVSAVERPETRELAVTSARSAAAAPDPADAQAPEFGYAPPHPDAVIEVQKLPKEYPIRGTEPWRTT